MPIEASWGPSQEFLNNNQAWADQMDMMQLRDAGNNGFKLTAALILEHNPRIGIQTKGPGGVSLYGQDAINYLLKMHGEARGTVISENSCRAILRNPRSPPTRGTFIKGR